MGFLGLPVHARVAGAQHTLGRRSNPGPRRDAVHPVSGRRLQPDLDTTAVRDGRRAGLACGRVTPCSEWGGASASPAPASACMHACMLTQNSERDAGEFEQGIGARGHGAPSIAPRQTGAPGQSPCDWAGGARPCHPPAPTIWKLDGPHAVGLARHGLALPVVEIADDLRRSGCRGPLAVGGAGAGGMDAKILIPLQPRAAACGWTDVLAPTPDKVLCKGAVGLAAAGAAAPPCNCVHLHAFSPTSSPVTDPPPSSPPSPATPMPRALANSAKLPACWMMLCLVRRYCCTRYCRCSSWPLSSGSTSRTPCTQSGN